jgi:tRNA A-37 threonylcarbamoyl transferase component Bud32
MAVRAHVSAILVKNRVFWANHAKNLPFKFKVGKPTNVAVFATPRRLKEGWKIEVMPEHGRTAVIGRAFFRAGKSKGIYRDIDAKGIGFVYYRGRGSRPRVPKSRFKTETETLGIMDRKSAENEIKNALAFIKAGIRTEVPIAAIQIDQIVNRYGRPVSIEAARQRALITHGTGQPVILLRGFGTKMRVLNLRKLDKRELRAAIDEAKDIVGRELERKLTDEEYVEWFAENLAEQVALMHSNGWSHNYLSEHNVTLDGRIVDLDSVRKLEFEDRNIDVLEAGRTLNRFERPGYSLRMNSFPWRYDRIISAMRKQQKPYIPPLPR